ncbi:uncharacterized protein ACR2FA_006277 [Aphomia sociella]
MHYNIVFIVILLCPCNILLNWVSSSSVPQVDYGEVKLFQAPASYDVESTVLLGDEASNQTDVGYKIKGSLLVEPVWSAPDTQHEFLLKFHLQSPKLYLRVKQGNGEFLPYHSMWDSHADSMFYAHWKSGVINTVYLDPSEEAEILNYKKSLISLFQFQALDGEHVETDISGKCNMFYESISTTSFQKTKRECTVETREGEDALGADGEEEAGAAPRVLYELSAALDALERVSAAEERRVGPSRAGLHARARQQLRRGAPARAPSRAARAASLDDARRALPAALAPLGLAPHHEEDPADDDTPWEEAVQENLAALETEAAGAGGGAAEAAAAARLLAAARAAPPAALAAPLRRADARAALPALCRLLGLAGTRAAHAAADAFLHLAGDEPLQALARDYLAAAALAERPHAALPAALLRLAGEARSPPVAAAALLAAAAAARRVGDAAERAVRDALARDLPRCKEDECRTVRLHALGNLRRADTAEALLAHAERGALAPALAALGALRAAPAAALAPPAARRRLLALACGAGRALELRAAALELLLRRAPPAALAALAAAAQRCGPAELRRLFWQRVRQRAADEPPVAAALRALPPHLAAWHAQAQPGTSSVLVRNTGWTALGWHARLESVQVAAAGLLRRGAVRLTSHAADGVAHDELAVEVWTRGLEAVAGVSEAAARDLDEGADGAADAPSAGIELVVGGARLPGLRLFDGQAELLGHVWAGAGSEPTPVLRALRPLASLRARAPLVAGAWLRVRRAGAAALALDAAAQVSLWSRGARASLELRAAAAAELRADVRAAGARLAAAATLSAAPRLRLAADLDFYDAVTLCVRAHLDDVEYARDATLRWRAPPGGRGARGGLATRRSRLLAPGRTLSLGADNDAACRTLVGADAA